MDVAGLGTISEEETWCLVSKCDTFINPSSTHLLLLGTLVFHWLASTVGDVIRISLLSFTGASLCGHPAGVFKERGRS